ncbi:MAG: 50S ribosomal protein L15 [Chloroflexi bacterium]|nr:50S ribosomal protein L15 [Chloroflexota bacterium]
MKLHDLRPAPGATKDRIRVGRGIAAGKGKTAGRGTKGQKARSGASIPAWFEGGQTPIHMRVPKLRGFRPINRIEYQVVNIGRISAYAEAGRLGELLTPKSPYTVNPEILRAAGLITKERQPVKILGSGDVSVPLFVLADAFTASARSKVEAAGGSVQTIAPAPEPVVAAEPEPTPAPEVEQAADEPAPVATAEVVEDQPEPAQDDADTDAAEA